MNTMRLLLFAALMLLSYHQANATDIYWSPSRISASISLPSTTNTSTYTTTLSKYVPLDPTFSWRINDTFGDCSAVSLSPSYGNSISSVGVSVQINWSVYNTVTTRECTIVAQTTTGQNAILTINIAVKSTLCNYQPDPVKFCQSRLFSDDVYCNTSTGACTCMENHYGPFCDYCESSVTCSGRGTCTQTAMCDCEPGYYGEDCSVACNRTTSCSDHGSCAADGSCKCDDGFVSNIVRDFARAKTSSPIQCSRAANCSNAGSCKPDGTCQCDSTATGDKCQYKKCPSCVRGRCNNSTGLCECEQNYYGSDCSKFCTALDTCSNNGVCSTSGSCSCNTNYYLTDCSRFCEPSATCSDAGECSPRGLCRCDNGFFGNTCSIFCNARTNCSSQGSCSATGCSCYEGYYGDKCQNARCPTCSTHGTCNQQTGQCDCETNWFMDTCDLYCSREETCNGHGACSGLGECICDRGFYGRNCDSQCSAATCVNGFCTLTGYCQCNIGYYGPTCDKYCSTSNCDMGTCDRNNGKCICFSNYHGSDCRTHCVASSCDSGGRCDENGKCVYDNTIAGSGNDGFSTGAIAGIVVGGVAGIGIVIIVVAVVVRKRRARIEYVDGYQLLNAKK